MYYSHYMKSDYMDLLLEVGKLYRFLTKTLQESIHNTTQIPSSLNHMELALLYELKDKTPLTPQKIAQEGEYMISHLLFNLKNMERNELIRLEGDTIDIARLQVVPKSPKNFDLFLKELNHHLSKDEKQHILERINYVNQQLNKYRKTT